MLGTTIDTPAGVDLIADHLDATLAAGEDLLAGELKAIADLGTPEEAEAAIAAFVAMLRRTEAILIIRLLQARRRAAEIGSVDASVKPLVRLFVANTAALADLIATYDTEVAQKFSSAGDSLAFLRRRGLVGEEQAALPKYSGIGISDRYRLGGVVELGPLLDLVATFLDGLDRRYGLYSAEEAGQDDAATETGTVAATVVADTMPEVSSPVPGSAADPQASLDDAIGAVRQGSEH